MPVTVQGPDGKTYQFPDGTDKMGAVRYFQKKGIGTATVSSNPNPPEAKSFQKFQGPFIERASSQFGEDLNDERNFIPNWKDALIPGLSSVVNELKNGWPNPKYAPRGDYAETIGHMGIPILTGLITHAADTIPGPEVAPVRPEPAWKTTNVTETEVPSILNRQPYAQPARPRIAKPSQSVRPEPAWKTAPPAEVPAESNEPPNPSWSRVIGGPQRIRPNFTPEAAPIRVQSQEQIPAPPKSPYSVDAPQLERLPEPRTRAEIMDDKIVEDQVRNAADIEQLQRIRAARREYQPKTKGELIDQANQARGIKTPDKPVKLTKTPGIKIPPPEGTHVPAADESMVPLMQRSIEMAKRRALAKASSPDQN